MGQTMSAEPTAPQLPADARVHLVGIGGAGMSALAWILLQRGHPVSGSDLRGGRAAAALQAMGAEVHVGHDAAHAAGADIVVVSTAVGEHNPEVTAARAAGTPVLRRAELLAALVTGYRGLFVAGTHGKTTTTSMLTVALQGAGLDPSFAIGGLLHDSGTSAHHGTGEIFVAEADESDGSFLAFAPECAIVTNLELDHHDYWPDLAALADGFARFLDQRTPQGLAICCADDPGALALAERARDPVRTYGEAADADVRVVDRDARPDGSTFRVVAGGRGLGRFRLRPPGRHNVLNAAAAIAAADWVEADMDAVGAALEGFSGAQRRFQRLGEVGGITVVDDYAHHPTELAAVLAAARQTAPRGRVVAAFQPHRFSRTAALGAELGAALGAADLVVVTDVYAAGEPPVPGVTGALVADAARRAGAETRYVAAAGELPALLLDEVRPGDLVLTLGAGDVTEAGPVLLRLLEDRHG
jgi:UDP-N-acetylmuramate--alanine ligase